MKISYRPEIDGLRAIAVLPVILFHAGAAWFSGGFVGVDVFFVISGFLITSLLISDLKQGCFSLATFYERRARRILPALFLVITTSSVAAWFLFPFSALAEFGKSVISVAAFVSNFFFLKHVGYFETQAELKPLLHTWSLAVEEQYYLIAPILLWVLWRFARKALAPVLLGLAMLSLVVAEHGVRHRPEAAFFMPHTRFWELLIGSLAALAVIRWKQVGRNNSLSAIGLGMILASIFWYDENTLFPGLYALLPTGGTALVLMYAGPGTWVNRLLTARVFVGIGLISYSAYLWHQPLFAYARHLSVHEPPLSLMLCLTIASLVLAYLSWRFVEQPFRNPGRVSRRTIFSASAASLAVCFALGSFVSHSSLAKSRIALSGASLSSLSDALRPNRGLDRACAAFTPSSKCTSGANPVALLWGDSYAMHLAQALRNSPTPLPFVQMTQSACPPILGTAPRIGKYNIAWGLQCIRHNELVIEWLTQHPEIRYVIVSSPFNGIEKESQQTQPDGTVHTVSGSALAEQFRLTLQRIADLNRTAIVVSPTPSPDYDVGRCLVIQHILGTDLNACHFPLAERRAKTVDIRLAQITQASQARLILLSDAICPGGTCRSHLDGVILYRDRGHLASEGSAKLGKMSDLAGRILEAAHLPHSERSTAHAQ